MSLTDDFRSAVDGEKRVDGPELLPTVLAEACVQVLGVGGAGLSVTRAVGSPRALRVPLGASDETAARAERLQTSLGEGPCLAATAAAEPVMADAAGIAARWPVFHAELIAQTPFQSVASLPVRWGEPAEPVAALDLYLTSPDAPSPRLLSGGITETIAEMLFTSTSTATATVERRGTWLPTWLASPPARQRMNVWVAVGILNGHAGLDSADALALLRAYAFGHGLTLDDLAESMSSQSLDPETVLGFN